MLLIIHCLVHYLLSHLMLSSDIHWCSWPRLHFTIATISVKGLLQPILAHNIGIVHWRVRLLKWLEEVRVSTEGDGEDDIGVGVVNLPDLYVHTFSYFFAFLTPDKEYTPKALARPRPIREKAREDCRYNAGKTQNNSSC